ncbi:RNA processing-related protein [Martensiomyces pterosporus]|nr:RNA processing-related protein [Martensiomyces pterosporus]
MLEFERKRVARAIAVPTDDKKVKEALREHGHPICLFGEDAGDRRTRLRYILSKMRMERNRKEGGAEMLELEEDQEDEGEQEEEAEEEFYTEGTQDLLEARRDIAAFSLVQAKNRLDRQRRECTEPLSEIRSRRQELIKVLESHTNVGSQVGDDRPLSRAIFSPNSQQLLTASWSGLIKLWDLPGCQLVRTFRGHTDRVGGISFHPQATLGLGDEVADFASGAADCNIYLWSLSRETPIGKLEGHASRVVHVDHHSSGRYLGSASYDGSWRLWDVARETELLLQEGHSREVFALRFQCDGALVATAGLDGVGRVWDMRSGRSVMSLEGHAKEIYALDWSPNGYQVATGSADNTVKIFDLRRLCPLYQIPAHKSMVTDVRFFHAQRPGPSLPKDSDGDGETQSMLCDGQYLASASNDGLINVWTSGDWKLQKSLAGHVGKVMGVDIAHDGSYIASAGYDRTFKLWGPDDIY